MFNYLILIILFLLYKIYIEVLKFLLFSKRPLLLVDRNYIEYFNDDLIPYKHYIPVKMDLSDLLEQVNWMINNPEKSSEIANNAFEYAIDNFTMDKILERVYYVYNNLK
jgi:glycosyltransferase involved in cell wall biosynthesis